MSGKGYTNWKRFLSKLGFQTTLEKDEMNWQAPRLQQLYVALDVLNSPVGESTKRAVARTALHNYGQLDDNDKIDFFTYLLTDYGVDAAAVKSAFAEWKVNEGATELVALIREVEPRRQDLLRDLNYAADGTLDLVAMRADLLWFIRLGHDQFKPLDYDFKHVLSSWFNPGFLRLEELTWDKAKVIKDHLVKYESVHPMNDGTELKKRVQPKDRKIYGFTHPATGNKPLIFVEVAFTDGLPSGLDEILEHQQPVNPTKADTAIFYSINSAFDGLAGISFGSLLIKQVTELVQETMPNVLVFATFSPIPKLREWLAASPDPQYQELTNKMDAHRSAPENLDESAVRNQLVAAAGHYITRSKNKKGLPADPVARFHLGNGATAWKIVWPASERDYVWQSSYGAMIIYRYEPEKIETQHEEFVQEQKIAVGPHFFNQFPGAKENALENTQSEAYID